LKGIDRMEKYTVKQDDQGDYVETNLRGRALLSHPMYNKGTSFPAEERRAFGLEGLLPTVVSDPDMQLERAYKNIIRKEDSLERYIGLASLQDRNETLYYKLVLNHVEEFAPIIYTPTVGLACQKFSRIFRRGRGMFLTPDDQGRFEEILGNATYEDVRLIVVTDGERILGLGDQGAGGMGIPIGKLALYTVAAGIHPSQTLPITLDVGTDNQELLDDELYVGWRNKRLRGDRYHAIVDEFVTAVKKRFPNALLQWEDFKKANAFDLLDKYKADLLSFNDDIQGTASVALAGVLAACRQKEEPFKDQRVVILGAGAAGIGIGRQIRDAFHRAGVTGDDLTKKVAILDSKGLLLESQTYRDTYKTEFTWPDALAESIGLSVESRDFMAVVKAMKPTVLIGTSGQPNVFSEDIIKEMAKHCERPAVFPFSNPTSKCEGKPVDVLGWTEGKALMATGSPFEPVEVAGKTIRIGQGNNVFIFPGVGLGALAAKSSQVTESMFTVAAETLAKLVSQEDLDAGTLFPRLGELRALTRAIGIAVAKEAMAAGVAEHHGDDWIADAVDSMMWTPEYVRLVPGR
jgi:malic enzyme